MLAAGRGHVVNLSSGLGYTPTATEPAYVTTKAAVLALSPLPAGRLGRPAASASPPSAPGVINTPIIDHTRFLGDQADPKVRRRTDQAVPPGPQARGGGRRPSSTAVERDRPVVPVGFEARLGWWMHRFLPLRAQQALGRARAAMRARTVAPRRSAPRPRSARWPSGGPTAGGPRPRTPSARATWTCPTASRSGHHRRRRRAGRHGLRRRARSSSSPTAGPAAGRCGRPVAHRLLEAGHQVVLYDQRGHGESTVGDDGFTIPRLGADLRAVLEAVDARDAVLAGHSMGGMTIQSLVAHHPDVVDERVRAHRAGGHRRLRPRPGPGRRARPADHRQPRPRAGHAQPGRPRPRPGHRGRRRPPQPPGRHPGPVRGLPARGPGRASSSAMQAMDLREGIAAIGVPDHGRGRQPGPAHPAGSWPPSWSTPSPAPSWSPSPTPATSSRWRPPTRSPSRSSP